VVLFLHPRVLFSRSSFLVTVCVLCFKEQVLFHVESVFSARAYKPNRTFPRSEEKCHTRRVSHKAHFPPSTIPAFYDLSDITNSSLLISPYLLPPFPLKGKRLLLFFFSPPSQNSFSVPNIFFRSVMPKVCLRRRSHQKIIPASLSVWLILVRALKTPSFFIWSVR